MEQFADRVREYYGDPLDPLARQFMFRLPPTVGELKRPPQVLLLGNHSSGKSTFINYLLGAGVQKTGVAPTDDGFTIITYGASEIDRDGATIISNPDLPFEGLRHFGDQLVSHVRLKQRPADLLRTVTLIDTPGMIDEAKAENGRGFDFPGAVRWFAERADLVMVFFDPDKPGTTGETLRVFKESLSGIDHKLLIVLNKMDQFQNLHDFARAYGALCWNLGKVIPRKDLPMIYNTFVPLAGKSNSALPMDDFERAREDLIDELRRTPTRRVDNQITQLESYAERLRMHAFVIDAAATRFRRMRERTYAMLVLLVGALGTAAFMMGLMPALPLLGVLAALSVAVIEYLSLPRAKTRIVARLDDAFESLHDRELLLRERSDDLRAMWAEIHPRVREVAEKCGLQSFAKLKWGDRQVLETLLKEDIPALRSELYGVMQDGPSRADDAARQQTVAQVDDRPQERAAMGVAPEPRRTVRAGPV